MYLKNEMDSLFYLVEPGTNIRYTVKDCVAVVDHDYIDEYVVNINNLYRTQYEKMLISEYHRKFSISELTGTALNTNMYYFLVRDGTSERHINYSGDLNLCTIDHVDRILPHLNRYGDTWMAMKVEDYYRTFGLVA